jgi:hypothetical protein
MTQSVTTRSLSEFLRYTASRPFQWGQDDCSLLLANWWQHIHGNDPAAWLRGTYSAPDEKDAVLVAQRGLQRLVSRIAAEAGAIRTAAPNTGDFGLIAIAGRPYGAICTGRVAGRACWAVRSETGVTFLTNPRILRAWSIHVLGFYLENAPMGS